MGGGLTKLAIDFGDAVIEACYAKIKTRLWVALISLLMMLIFGLVGIIFLFVLAYAALAKTYDPTTAAFVLFGVCAFIVVGTFVVYKFAVASLKDKKTYQDAAQDAKQDTEKLPPELFLGAEAGRLAQDFFGKNIPTSLITSLLIGAAVGYMPKTSFKIITRLAGMKRLSR